MEGRNRSAYYVAVTARAYRMAIDDWRRDPVRWRPDAYMRELATIPNRGYSLAFHDGKLTHHAHNFEDTHTLAAWEYAGMIVDVAEDAFLLAVKNRWRWATFWNSCLTQSASRSSYAFTSSTTYGAGERQRWRVSMPGRSQ